MNYTGGCEVNHVSMVLPNVQKRLKEIEEELHSPGAPKSKKSSNYKNYAARHFCNTWGSYFPQICNRYSTEEEIVEKVWRSDFRRYMKPITWKAPPCEGSYRRKKWNENSRFPVGDIFKEMEHEERKIRGNYSAAFEFPTIQIKQPWQNNGDVETETPKAKKVLSDSGGIKPGKCKNLPKRSHKSRSNLVAHKDHSCSKMEKHQPLNACFRPAWLSGKVPFHENSPALLVSPNAFKLPFKIEFPSPPPPKRKETEMTRIMHPSQYHELKSSQRLDFQDFTLKSEKHISLYRTPYAINKRRVCIQDPPSLTTTKVPIEYKAWAKYNIGRRMAGWPKVQVIQTGPICAQPISCSFLK